MDIQKPMTPAEAARVARFGAAMAAAKTLVERYRAEVDYCANRDERDLVWRCYARPMLDELAMRDFGTGRIRWRKSRTDDELWTPWSPYWRRVSDEELYALEDALIRARNKGHNPDADD